MNLHSRLAKVEQKIAQRLKPDDLQLTDEERIVRILNIFYRYSKVFSEASLIDLLCSKGASPVHMPYMVRNILPKCCDPVPGDVALWQLKPSYVLRRNQSGQVNRIENRKVSR